MSAVVAQLIFKNYVNFFVPQIGFCNIQDKMEIRIMAKFVTNFTLCIFSKFSYFTINLQQPVHSCLEPHFCYSLSEWVSLFLYILYIHKHTVRALKYTGPAFAIGAQWDLC